MELTILTGPPGGGKSSFMRRKAVEAPGLYLFALPTIEVIEEQASAFAEDAPHVRRFVVHSASGKGRTGRRLDEARRDVEEQQALNAVIFTTHASLMEHGLEGFDDWHVRIDEAPSAVQSGTLNIGGGSRSLLVADFDLSPVEGTSYSVINRKPGSEAPSWIDVQRDTGTARLGEFLRLSAEPDRVFVTTTAWESTQEIAWFALWTPLALSHCASIWIAGSGYADHPAFLIAKGLHGPDLNVLTLDLREPRSAQPAVSIHYFARGHEGTTSLWGTSEGRRMIKAVCDHLGDVLTPESYWSGNDVVYVLMEHRLPGTYIKPLAMGLNKHRALTSCAYIYSSKATPDDHVLIEAFDLTRDQLGAHREGDAVSQFVLRGAIRNADYGGPYDIYLYSESQAGALRDKLLGFGLSNVRLCPVESAGIMEVAFTPTGKVAQPVVDLVAKRERDLAKDRSRKRQKRKERAEAAGRWVRAYHRRSEDVG